MSNPAFALASGLVRIGHPIGPHTDTLGITIGKRHRSEHVLANRKIFLSLDDE